MFLPEELDDLAALWSGGRDPECEAKHTQHATVLVSSTFGFIEVMTGEPVSMKYCPADDDISRSIMSTGEWEGPLTSAVREALADIAPDGVFIDFGAHIGWYTMLAASLGYDVLAVEADSTLLAVLERNVQRLGLEDLVTPCRGWIGSETPVAKMNDVVFIKMDMEGAEPDAMRVSMPIIEQGVDFILMEISPVFHSGYPALVNVLENLGYEGTVLGEEPREGGPQRPQPYDASWLTYPQFNVLWRSS